MSEKQGIIDRIYKLRWRLSEIEEAERFEKLAEYQGKFFKATNNYSCPESPDDYWDVYYKTLKLDDRNMLDCWSFQKDKNGKVTVEDLKLLSPMLLEKEIKREEFNRIWGDLILEFGAK